MSKNKRSRKEKLMPGGIPRHIRVYDDGPESTLRYTIVYTGKEVHDACGVYPYIILNELDGETPDVEVNHSHKGIPLDMSGCTSVTRMGRKGFLGKRITFDDLPEQCQEIVVDHYCDHLDISEEDAHNSDSHVKWQRPHEYFTKPFFPAGVAYYAILLVNTKEDGHELIMVMGQDEFTFTDANIGEFEFGTFDLKDYKRWALVEWTPEPNPFW